MKDDWQGLVLSFPSLARWVELNLDQVLSSCCCSYPLSYPFFPGDYPHLHMQQSCVSYMILEIDPFNKKASSSGEDVMTIKFSNSFSHLALTVDRTVAGF